MLYGVNILSLKCLRALQSKCRRNLSWLHNSFATSWPIQLSLQHRYLPKTPFTASRTSFVNDSFQLEALILLELLDVSFAFRSFNLASLLSALLSMRSRRFLSFSNPIFPLSCSTRARYSSGDLSVVSSGLEQVRDSGIVEMATPEQSIVVASGRLLLLELMSSSSSLSSQPFLRTTELLLVVVALDEQFESSDSIALSRWMLSTISHALVEDARASIVLFRRMYQSSLQSAVGCEKYLWFSTLHPNLSMFIETFLLRSGGRASHRSHELQK